MKTSNWKKSLILLTVLPLLAACSQQSLLEKGQQKIDQTQASASSNVDYGKESDEKPSKTLAESVLVDAVKKQLGNNVKWNGSGAFVVNDNKSSLNADVSSAPYVHNTPLNSDKQLGVADALLNKTTRQYKNRNETSSNGKSNSETIKPAGWHQIMLKSSPYNTLYNRGHLIGYAIAAGLSSFDASEANPENIAAQTAWANQASNGEDDNTGQNYYETQVRKAIDKGKTVRYQVKPIYVGDDLVPMGNEIQAKSKDGSLDFNVFVPNVQPGVKIDYATGYGSKE
ncbi:DNA/RNA non-specific endonuclease [Lactococcus termiticola]|uniref:DNA-entry nuclease n=1 Tax=Lactococcus termiticola TaxID=2169526 RepID=A0A2R5HKT2_9LACT|nr:DNA/RNA non-specific endonuclease [Lactococcus termiticola]GBG97251.1 DNA-entry nuclease [Lactococcus termiticola]